MRAWDIRQLVHLVAGVALVVTAGCTSRQHAENEGAVCAFSSANVLDSSAAPQSFAAGQPVFLRYDTGQCHSSSCSTDREASCQVAVDSKTLTVTSSAAWTAHGGPGVACTTDCGLLSASCETPPLEAGTYVIRHGADEVTLTIPSSPDAAPCTRPSPW